MRYAGIDPGFEGGVGWIEGDGHAYVRGTPILTVSKKSGGTKREYDAAGMVAIVNEVVLGQPRDVKFAVERVHAMPKAGAVGMFSFGQGYGLWIGILSALGVAYDLVEPARWKKAIMDGMGKEKAAARFRAQQLFPALTSEFKLVKSDGKAESLLIAEYRRRLG